MVVVLAGGTGGAKLARGMLDVVGDELVVVANTADDVEIYGAYVSPRPGPRAPSGSPTASTSAAGACDGDTFDAMDQLRELGDDVWFNLGDRDLAIGLRRAQRLAEGATLDRGASPSSRAALGLGARVLPMADEPVRTRVLARGALARLPGVHDPRARRGPGRRRRARRASRRARRRREVARGDRGARARSSSARRTRSSRSARSSRVPGMREALRARAGARRRRVAHRRRRGAQGPDRGRSWPGPGCRSTRGGDRARLRRACSTASSPTSAADGLPARSRPTRSWPTPARRRRVRARTSLALRWQSRLPMTDRRHPARQALRRRQAAAGRRSARGTRRALAEAMVTDVLDALRRVAALDEVVVVTAEPAREALAPRATAPSRRTTRRAAASRAPRALGIALGASERGAERVLLVPGDCPALDPREVDALLAGAHDGARVVIVPDRHGTGTNALLLRPPDAIAPSFGPGSRARHERPRARGRRRAARRRARARSCSTSTPPTTSRRCAPRSTRAPAAPRTRAGCCAARPDAAPGAHCGASAAARSPALAARSRPGDDLAALLAAPRPASCEPGDVLVVAHKVVSKAEGARASRSPTSSPASARASSRASTARTRATSRSCSTSRAERRCAPSAACSSAAPATASCAPTPASTPPTPPRDGRARPAARATPTPRARALRAALPGARPPWSSPTRSAARGATASATSRSASPACAPLDDWRGRARRARAASCAPPWIAVADEAAAAADLVRDKDSREPAVVVRGLERHVTADDGPGPPRSSARRGGPLPLTANPAAVERWSSTSRRGRTNIQRRPGSAAQAHDALAAHAARRLGPGSRRRRGCP